MLEKPIKAFKVFRGVLYRSIRLALAVVARFPGSENLAKLLKLKVVDSLQPVIEYWRQSFRLLETLNGYM